MKEQLYSLVDGIFHAAITHIIEHCRAHAVDPVIVGGVAVQAHIVKMAQEGGILPSAAFFRKTDDLDTIVTPGVSEEQIFHVMSALPPLRNICIEDSLYDVELVRAGAVRSLIGIQAMTPTGLVYEEIKLTVSNKPEDDLALSSNFFSKEMADAVSITLKHVSVRAELRASVLSLEHLIAKKIARRRVKDHKDVDHLAAMINRCGAPVNLEKVEDALGYALKKEEGLWSKYEDFLERSGKRRPPPSISGKQRR